jgi:hypothetical protein
MRLIGLKEFKAAIAAVVAKYGAEYVYGDGKLSCYYTDPPTESRRQRLSPTGKTVEGCIIGCALRELGVALPHLHDPANHLPVEGLVKWAKACGVGWTMAPAALDLAIWVQDAQDEGVPWGQAMKGKGGSK